MESPTYEELCALEPRLLELESRVGAVRDPRDDSFFCSNYVWMPLNADLKDLIGVARRPTVDSPGAGLTPQERQSLESSFSYEVVYLHLSRLLPGCRDCGCRAFEPYQLAQASEAEGAKGAD